MADPEVLIFPTVDDLVASAAQRIAGLIEAAISLRGSCLLALSGGSLPPNVYHQLAIPPLRNTIPWEHVSIVWADERYVPFDSPNSNYLITRQTLLDHVPIPSDQVYPVPTYYTTPGISASVYSHQIETLLAAHAGQIDIVVLGMGPDGHTASLFPGYPAIDAAEDQLAIAVEDAPKAPPIRISLTPSALNRAANAIFLVAGADKAAKVREALYGVYNPHTIPAQIIRPTNGQVIWMLDTAAAAHL
ncbi:MAG: 6-phosphogluconolactonase [Oscillochloris sp.]|nr:6-phosphogluconolactonase [Oscillochloris sp.]